MGSLVLPIYGFPYMKNNLLYLGSAFLLALMLSFVVCVWILFHGVILMLLSSVTMGVLNEVLKSFGFCKGVCHVVSRGMALAMGLFSPFSSHV